MNEWRYRYIQFVNFTGSMSFTIKAKYLVPGSNTCIMISWIYDENGFENDLMEDFFVLFFQIFIERNEILAGKAKCLVFIFHSMQV